MRTRLDQQTPGDDLAPLLVAFVAGTLGGVALVLWLGHDSSPPVLVAAIVCDLGLTAVGALGLVRLLREDPVAPGMGLMMRTAWSRRLALAPAVRVPLLVGGALLGAPRATSTPVATLRGFLTAAVVDNDGQTACTYLTAHARVDFEGHGLTGAASCQSFFGGAILRLGDLSVASDAQLDRLRYAVTGQGGDLLVTVSYDGQAMRFLLRPANGFERHAFGAPETPWRIDSAINALGTGAFAPALTKPTA